MYPHVSLYGSRALHCVTALFTWGAFTKSLPEGNEVWDAQTPALVKPQTHSLHLSPAPAPHPRGTAVSPGSPDHTQPMPRVTFQPCAWC